MTEEHKPHGDDHAAHHDDHHTPAADDHAPPATHETGDHATHDDHHASAADDHGTATVSAHEPQDHHAAEESHDVPADTHHHDSSSAEHEPAPAHEPHVEPAHHEAVVTSEPASVSAEPDEAVAAPVYAHGARKGRGGSKSAGSETLEIAKTIFFALLIALVLRVLLFQPFTIPSASMEPNLYEGDYIVVSKWSYGYSKHSIPFSPPIIEGRLFEKAPARGDIVVFKLPRDNKTDYIKRVIGLPGDRIQMIANQLYINGDPVKDVVIGQAEVQDVFGVRGVTRLRETLPNGKTFTIQDFGPNGDLDNTPVYQVPEGYYFMMGDNRDNSIDSRVESGSGVGLVPAENLVGKAQVIMFSWKPGASLFDPVSWVKNLRTDRAFQTLN